MKKADISVILYCLFIANCTLSETQLMEMPIINVLLTTTRYVVVCLLAIKSLRWQCIKMKRKLFALFVVLFISIIVNLAFCSGGVGLLLLGVVIVSMRECKIGVERLIIVTLSVMWMCCFLVVFLSCVGILEDRTAVRYIGSNFLPFYDGSSLRHTYGFLVQNQVPQLLLLTYLYRIVLKGIRMKFLEHVIIFVANIMFLFTFGSRNTFIVIIVTMIAYFIARKISDNRMNKNKEKRFSILWLIYPICFLLSLLVSLKYDGTVQIWRVANNLLMNRIIMSQTAIESFGISFFGAGNMVYENLVVEGIKSSTIDNGYMNLLIRRGIFITIIIVVAWAFLTYRAERERNFYLVFVLLALAGSNLIDGHLTSYKMIPFFVLMLYKYGQIVTLKEKTRIN